MNKMYKQLIWSVVIVVFACSNAQVKVNPIHASSNIDSLMPDYIRKLMRCYPDHIIGYADNFLIWKDSTKTLYDDSLQKSTLNLLVQPDIEDQSKYQYKKGVLTGPIEKYKDPGRIRNETFFKKMYGGSKESVRRNLVEIVWCPKTVNQRLLVTRINGVDKKIDSISATLDSFPELRMYVRNIAGTFNWRNISGTSRLSAHSFGMTIDINVDESNYWQWDCKCIDEQVELTYKNKIPQKLVEIFERYGFVWGGKWYHYDTMHFEYRPDLL